MKTCRLCLAKTAEIYIFDEDLNLLNRILSYCKLKMYKNDGLPDFVCVYCVGKLEEVVTFINQCEESDRVLRSNLDVDYVNIVKTEEPDIKEEVKVEFKEELKLIEDDFDFHGNDFNDNFQDEYDEDKDFLALDPVRNVKVKNKDKKGRRKKDIFDKSGQLCPICGKHFTKNAYYEQHMQTHGEKNFVCDECPKSFHLKDKLRAHKLTHSSIRKHSCEFCDKTFKTKHHANLHMEYVHRKSKPIPCNLCGKVFYRPQYLKTHIVTHTAERKYECELCHKTYYLRHLLTTHMRVHTGERPYACRFCDSKFTVLQSLKEHERLHTGEKPFQCPTCLKGFAQKGNMKSHFRYNHKGMDFKKAMTAMRLNQAQM